MEEHSVTKVKFSKPDSGELADKCLVKSGQRPHQWPKPKWRGEIQVKVKNKHQRAESPNKHAVFNLAQCQLLPCLWQTSLTFVTLVQIITESVQKKKVVLSRLLGNKQQITKIILPHCNYLAHYCFYFEPCSDQFPQACGKTMGPLMDLEQIRRRPNRTFRTEKLAQQQG